MLFMYGPAIAVIPKRWSTKPPRILSLFRPGDSRFFFGRRLHQSSAFAGSDEAHLEIDTIKLDKRTGMYRTSLELYLQNGISFLNSTDWRC
jgi:hypothetical protein